MSKEEREKNVERDIKKRNQMERKKEKEAGERKFKKKMSTRCKDVLST